MKYVKMYRDVTECKDPVRFTLWHLKVQRRWSPIHIVALWIVSVVTSVLEESTASIFSVNPGFCLNTLPFGISVRMATVLSHSCRDILLLFALFAWESWGRIIVDTSENFSPQYYSTAVGNTVLAAQLGCFWWRLGVMSIMKIKTNECFKK